MPEKFTSPIQSLYANSRSRIHACGGLSLEFTTWSSAHQCWSLSPFFSNFIIEIFMKIALFCCEYSAIDICTDRKLPDLGYMRTMLFLVMWIKCKMLLQDRIDSKPKLILAIEQLEEVGALSYLGSCILPVLVLSWIKCLCTHEIHFAFTNSRHLWHRCDIRLPINGSVHTATVRPVLSYGSKHGHWEQKLYKHRCFRSILGRMWWG